MRVVPIQNARVMQLTTAALRSQSLHGLRPGLDNVVRLRLDNIEMERVSGVWFRMQSKEPSLNLRELGKQITTEPGNLLAIRWSRHEEEALRRTPGIFPFSIVYEYRGERLALAEGVIEIEA